MNKIIIILLIIVERGFIFCGIKDDVLKIKIYNNETLQNYYDQYNESIKVPKQILLNHKSHNLPEKLRLFAMRWIA